MDEVGHPGGELLQAAAQLGRQLVLVPARPHRHDSAAGHIGMAVQWATSAWQCSGPHRHDSAAGLLLLAQRASCYVPRGLLFLATCPEGGQVAQRIGAKKHNRTGLDRGHKREGRTITRASPASKDILLGAVAGECEPSRQVHEWRTRAHVHAHARTCSPAAACTHPGNAARTCT